MTEVQEDERLARARKRFARRQWARRWRVWRWLVALVLVVALAVTGVWLVWFSSVLAVQGVTVTGTGFLSRAQVVEAAAVPDEEPLVRVDLESVRRRVAGLAAVKSVEVTREWPDRISIKVVERKPVAVVQIGGRFRAVDSDGVLFRDYDARPASLPVVQSNAVASPETLAEAAAVASALPKALSRRVDHLEVRSVDEIRLVLRDGRLVVWGSAEASDDKARVLTVLLGQKGRTYDVSVPGQPTISQSLRP